DGKTAGRAESRRAGLPFAPATGASPGGSPQDDLGTAAGQGGDGLFGLPVDRPPPDARGPDARPPGSVRIRSPDRPRPARLPDRAGDRDQTGGGRPAQPRADRPVSG